MIFDTSSNIYLYQVDLHDNNGKIIDRGLGQTWCNCDEKYPFFLDLTPNDLITLNSKYFLDFLKENDIFFRLDTNFRWTNRFFYLVSDFVIGIDETFRYFLYQIDPKLQDLKFEIPIKVRKGSWEVLIPHDISHWLLAAGGAGFTAYVTAALVKMAENDVGYKGLKDIFKNVIEGIKWVIKIASHLDSMQKKKFFDTKFKEENGETLIGITNEKGEILYVPKRFLDMYVNCPEKLFSKLTKTIEQERELEIGINENIPLDKDDTERSIKITYKQKSIFYREDDPDEMLFPELIHDQYVELFGHITRGNENSNTIEFEFKNHILTCYPEQGNVSKYKSLLFSNALVKGYVDRKNQNGEIIEKRPRIRYIEISGIVDTIEQLELFDK